MRRLSSITLLLIAAALVVVGVHRFASSADDSAHYRVDAIFDAAKGVIPGNVVQIAGAKVGSVDNVVLTRDYKARVEMTIEKRFAPFHADARCQIRPVALIGEMAVNCDPGSPRGPALTGGPHGRPTVPVQRTTVPVDFTDLFSIWQAPVSQRLSIVFWTLGAGVAGRGEDLNRILQRTNPTLLLAHDTFQTLNAERRRLVGLVDSSDRLLAGLAPRREVVQEFLDRTSRVLSRTAEHRGALGESIQRLPALLAATQPALEQVDLVAKRATPVLRDLHAAAPGIKRVVASIGPLSTVARPALRRLGAAAVAGRKQLGKLTPAVRELAAFAGAGKPVAQLLNSLFTSLRERGFVEGLNSIPYYAGSVISRFDSLGHVTLGNFLLSACAASTLPECASKFTATPGVKRRSSRRRPTSAAHRPPAAPAATHGDPAPAKPPAPQRPAATPNDVVSNLLDFLLK